MAKQDPTITAPHSYPAFFSRTFYRQIHIMSIGIVPQLCGHCRGERLWT